MNQFINLVLDLYVFPYCIMEETEKELKETARARSKAMTRYLERRRAKDDPSVPQ